MGHIQKRDTHRVRTHMERGHTLSENKWSEGVGTYIKEGHIWSSRVRTYMEMGYTRKGTHTERGHTRSGAVGTNTEIGHIRRGGILREEEWEQIQR